MHRDHEQHLTIAEAAETCGVSTDTIKRDLRDGRYPRAARGEGANDPWLVPVDDLVAVGRLQVPPGRTFGDLRREQVEQRRVVELQIELAEVHARLQVQEDVLALLGGLLDRRLAEGMV